ncbi:MAG: ESPR-type extended signal peptide-containing protein, partial [Negativicoccus succinicivorans]|uniref:ESPR-type extended signal peptide-containing protein n=1 Tax=Negativicoccus succinicivorans TaxID=620903 RepID=UPI0029107B85
MNKIYKLVWSKVRSAWVVTSEVAKGHGKASSSGRNRNMLKAGVVMALLGGFMTAGISPVAAELTQDQQAVYDAVMANLVKKMNIRLSDNNIVAGRDIEVYGGHNAVFGTDYQNGSENRKTMAAGNYNTVIGVGNLAGYTAEKDPQDRSKWIYSKVENGSDSGNVVVGMNNTATRSSIVIGAESEASSHGTSVGSNNKVIGDGDYGLALGNDLTVNGEQAVAIGSGSKATVDYTMAIGQEAIAEKESSIALGNTAKAENKYSVAVGSFATATARSGVAIGSSSLADREKGAIGYLADANTTSEAWKATRGAISIGNSDKKYTRQLTGLAAGTEDTDAVNVAQLKALNTKVDNGAIHYVSVTPIDKAQTADSNYFNDGAKGDGGIAIGQNAASQGRGIAIGYKSNATPKEGATLNLNSFEGIAIGQEAHMEVPGGIALGLRSKVEGTLNTQEGNVNELGTVALGTDAYAKGNGAAAFGWKAHSDGEGAMAFGMETKAGMAGAAFGGHANAATGAVAMGWQANAHNSWATSIGTSSDAKGESSTALGGATTAEAEGSTAVGFTAVAKEVNSVALGAGAVANTKAGAVGYIATGGSATFEEALATLDKKEDYDKWTATVNASKAEYDNLTKAFNDAPKDKKAEAKQALDDWKTKHADFVKYLTAKEKLEATWKATEGAVSVGADTVNKAGNRVIKSRQITNVAAGTQDTDAVNVAQLKAVNSKADKLDKRISEEKAHYFSVSGVSRDDRSNYHNNATNGVEKSLAIGEYVVANDYSVAIGYGAKNNFDTEYKNGQTVKRTHYYSMGLLKDRVGSPRFNGEWAYDKIRGSHTVAIGDRASTNDTMGIAIGYKASAGKLGTNNAVAPQIAVGALAEASGSSTIAVGEGATAEMDSSIAIGTGAYAKPTGSEDIHSIAFGTYSRSEATESMAFGHHAKALTNRSIAIGAGSEAKASSGVALGYSSVADRARSLDPYLKGEGKVSDTVYGTLGAVSIGNPYGDRLYDNIRVGWYAEKGTRQLTNLAAGSEDSDAVNVAQLRVIDDKKANLDASNLTKASDKSAWATVLGTGTITQNDANLVTGDTVYQYIKNNVKATKVTVDGNENSQDGNLKIKKTDDNGQLTYDLSLNDEITIGKKGTPGEDGAPGKDGVDGKIGINGKDGRSADITIGKGAAGVDGKDGEAGQAGKDGITRIIYKDEKGDTRQVATLDDGLKFKGDNDTVVTRKLNTQLAITGGITNESLVTTGNIGVFGKQDGGLAVKLAKNLTGLSSAEFKDGDKVTNITAQTITQKDGDNVTNIKAGDVSVTKKDGDTTKTVNLWDLSKKVETNAKATKVTVDGKENNSDDADANLKITNKTVNGQTTYDLSLNNEITLGKAGTPGEDGAPGKDGVDGKIGINGKDGRSADITIGKGAAGVDGKDGEAGQAGKDGITRIIYKDEKGET